MVFRTALYSRLSTWNSFIFSKDIYFSHAKNGTHLAVYSAILIFTIHFFCLIPVHAQGGENSLNLISEITRLAQQGDPEAQFSLALMYGEGRTMPHDVQKNVYWLTKAAQQNLPAACLYLGIKFEFGNGVQQDKKQASLLYEKTALQGWPMAQYLLAMLLLDEETLENNRINAGAWLKLASRQDYPRAEEKYLEIERTLTAQERTLLIRRYEHYAGRIKNRPSGTN